jgi:hypothetical protein
MSEKIAITAEDVICYLKKETDSLLCSNGVYDIGNYGWQSEDTVDPEYAGHAMWQTNPPFEMEWEYVFDNAPVRNKPTDKQKLLSIAGNDFEGLMQASRLSLGLCLFHQTSAINKPLQDNHYFWLHHTNSILHLNMASDRIREYFTVAFYGKTEKKYNRRRDDYRGNRYDWYTTPFIEARDLCLESQSDSKVTQALSPLPEVSAEIHLFRQLRNKIVHEISTKLARREKELVEGQQEAYGSPRPVKTADLSFEELVKHQSTIGQEQREELLAASSTLIGWYKALAKFSSHIFESEYWLRKFANNTEMDEPGAGGK